MLKKKTEATDFIIEYLAWFENQTSHRVQTILSDGGREFVNKKLKTALNRLGTEFLSSCPATPKQNGVAERNNQTIVKLSRTMLIAAGLDHRFWAQAVICSTYLLNITNTCEATGKTAFETIYKVPPNYKNLRPFGSRCYFYKKFIERSKFSPRGFEGIMLGYTERIDGYRVLEVGTQTIHVTKDVRFINEKAVPREIATNVD